ncbi:hypothetical protein AN478_10315 [Thiohalorhabdus denitrificans]|nr:hypothetical protein AN478_10315 [Thiohalorhabdus denitrificans]
MLGATVAGGLALGSLGAQADTNPFQVADLGSGYMVAENQAEGRCGGATDDDKKGEEGKCGGMSDSDKSKGEKDKAAKDKKDGGEGKCGEGKCAGG